METSTKNNLDFSSQEMDLEEPLARAYVLENSGFSIASLEYFDWIPYEPLPSDVSDGIGETEALTQ